MVVEDMVKRLGLTNVEITRGRVEELPKKRSYDFVIGRAVTALPTFFDWVHNKIRKGARNSPANGILYLKGGDYTGEQIIRTTSGKDLESRRNNTRG